MLETMRVIKAKHVGDSHNEHASKNSDFYCVEYPMAKGAYELHAYVEHITFVSTFLIYKWRILTSHRLDPGFDLSSQLPSIVSIYSHTHGSRVKREFSPHAHWKQRGMSCNSSLVPSVMNGCYLTTFEMTEHCGIRVRVQAVKNIFSASYMLHFICLSCATL